MGGCLRTAWRLKITDRQDPREGSPSAPPTRHVYVVDDDGDLRRSLYFLLATRQIVATSFSSGTDFLDIVSDLAPAPIILDIRMR